jgi:phosphatidylglycerol:prolipoprotein diacylglycerol transferase
MELGAWVHDIDPWLVRFPGWSPLQGIRWYGTSYALGFLVGFLVLRWLAKRGAILIPKARVADVVIMFAFGAVIGGRLGYAVFYQPELFWTFESTLPWWGLLDLSSGGMASHGGMLGVALAALLISRGFKDDKGVRQGRCSFWHVIDAGVLSAPFGLLFGRLANFINGELLGRIVAMPGEKGPWWSVRFPQEIEFTEGGGLYSRPIAMLPEPQSQQMYAGLVETVRDYRMSSTDSDVTALMRMIETIQSGSGESALEAARALEPYLAARAPSQLLQALAEGVVVGLIVWFVARLPRKPGVITAWFLVSYGALRIATEVVRLPDAHFEVGRPGGLSRGQWLSLVMILGGLALLAFAARRGRERIGGWLRSTSSPGALPSEAGDQESGAEAGADERD